MAVLQQGMTLEAFLELPERKPALEYIDGTVEQKVPPRLWHAALQSEIVIFVNAFARPPRLARAFSELRATFGGRSVVPDVAVFVQDRLPIDAHGKLVDNVVTPPDLIFEIISPGQQLSSLRGRCGWYVEHGVRVAVLVNPRDSSVEIRRGNASSDALRGTDVVELGDVIPGFSFTVDQLFEALSAG